MSATLQAKLIETKRSLSSGPDAGIMEQMPSHIFDWLRSPSETHICRFGGIVNVYGGGPVRRDHRTGKRRRRSRNRKR